MSAEKQLEFGEYRVIRRIGKGGFGSVYLAENSLFAGRAFAIKVFNTPDEGEDGVTPLRDELANLIGLAHSNIVQVRGFGVETRGGKSEPYIVMDFIEGPNGGSYNLKQHLIASGGRLTPIEVKRVFRQILSALALVHKKQIAHLDLKPENILLDKDLNAYVSDFGISQTVTSHSLRIDRQPTIHGFSPIYASPEQIRHSYGSRHSDIFSLGVMILECLSGRRPEVVHSPTHPRVDYTKPSGLGLDPKWDGLMERSLSVDPAYRFPNAEIFLRALEQMPSGPPGAVRDMAQIQDSPSPTPPISVTTPRPAPRLGGSQPGTTSSTVAHTPTHPTEGRISRLLERSAVSTATGPSEQEEEAEVIPPPSRLALRVMGICGGLSGVVFGIFFGVNIGDLYGRSHAVQMSKMMGLFLGQDLGNWAGREMGAVVGFILGLFLGALLGWGLGIGLVHLFHRWGHGGGKAHAEDRR
jgi:serine/threonine protein kinase